MGGLNLQQCLAVLLYLVGPRRGHVRRLMTGARHLSVFDAFVPELDAAVERVNARRVGERVHQIAQRHMEVAAALALALRAKAVDFLVDVSVRDAAQLVYQELLSGRLGPALSNAGRVTVAINAHKLRMAAAPQLALLPASFTQMLDVWIEAGDAFVAGINGRTDQVDKGVRTNQELVTGVRVALGNLRAAIRSEMVMYPELPASLETQILGMADELSRRRTARPTSQVETAVVESVDAEPPAETDPEPSTLDEPGPATPLHGPESHIGHS